jgi:hypothetical protein
LTDIGDNQKSVLLAPLLFPETNGVEELRLPFFASKIHIFKNVVTLKQVTNWLFIDIGQN